MNPSSAPKADGGAAADRIARHAFVDRCLHWLMAAATLVLLGTAFLPILGLEFPWVAAHWIAGFVLILGVLLHTVRTLFWQSLRSMWIGAPDLRDLASIAGFNLRLSDRSPNKPGKYSFAQKLIHHVFTLVVLLASVTGGLMMVRIDTPWWDRNPYWLAEQSWGLVYVLHGLAALCLITIVMCHIYFALRPEKWAFLRAMVLGWITRAEYEANHDTKRWQVRQ